MYWTTNCFVELPGIRSLMARDRFEIILQYLHVADNSCLLPSDDPNCDKLFKIRPMLDHLVQQWQSAYHPSRDVKCRRVALKGRSHMIVYKPNKPHKCMGSGRVADRLCVEYGSVYTGCKSSTEVGMTKTVVTSLCAPIYGLGHRVHGQLLQFTGTVSRTQRQRGGSLWHSTSQPPWCTWPTQTDKAEETRDHLLLSVMPTTHCLSHGLTNDKFHWSQQSIIPGHLRKLSEQRVHTETKELLRNQWRLSCTRWAWREWISLISCCGTR